MIKAMELRNLARNTQRYYLSAVIGLACYYQQSPDKLSHEQICKLINAAQNLKHRLILMTTYSARLRASEAAAL